MISNYALFSKTNLFSNKKGFNNIKRMLNSNGILSFRNSFLGCKNLMFLHVNRTKGFSNIQNNNHELEDNVQRALQFYEGKNVKKDYKKSFFYYNLAAKQGSIFAHFVLGLFYYSGIGIKVKNKYKSFKHFKYAAINNNAIAQYCYGICLIRGEGVKINLLKGIRYFRLSAENGYNEAQYLYGRCLYEGLGIGKNVIEAKKFFKKSINQGNKKAEFYYDLCLNYKSCPNKFKLNFNHLM